MAKKTEMAKSQETIKLMRTTKSSNGRSQVVKGSQKDLARVAGSTAGQRVYDKAQKKANAKGKPNPWKGLAKAAKAETKAIKNTTKSFKGTK